MIDDQIFVSGYRIEEIDRRSNGAPLYDIWEYNSIVFVGTLPECVAYLQLKRLDIEGILKITGRYGV